MNRKNRVNPKTKRKYRKAIRNVVKGLGRKVKVYKPPLKTECPSCYFDKLTDRSTGKCKFGSLYEADQLQAEWEAAGNTEVLYKYFIKGRCPVCRGIGYRETQRKVWVECLVTWDPEARNFGNQMIYTPAGSEGSTIVRLKTDTKHFNLFRDCKKLDVDGVECKIARPPIMHGLGTQALLIITAFTTEKPQTDSNEILKEYT
jgi:hypothetical protein